MVNSTSDIQTVGDLMTGDLLALRPVDSVARARELLSETGLHALPIIDGTDTVGVVTLADCQGRLGSDLLGDLATRPPVTIGTGASVVEAARLMREETIHHLLVVEDADTDGEVVGILSTFDLLKIITD